MAYVQLFASQYARLMGILGGGFYLHNISLPIIARNPNPKTNERDLFIGYFMVFFTYVCFGIVGYLGFSAENYRGAWKDGAIQQNCLFMYPIAEGWRAGVATFVRFSVFLHITTVNALLFACERAQILLLVTGQQETESYAVQIFLNSCLILPAFLLAIYYPEVGDLAGILGAAATMLVIYIVPNVTYLKMKWDATYSRQDEDKFEYETRRQEEDRGLLRTGTGQSKEKDSRGTDGRLSKLSRSTLVNEEEDQDLEDEMAEFKQRIKPTSKGMLALIIVFSLFVTSYGILALAFQLQG